jgi:hypothetical protein
MLIDATFPLLGYIEQCGALANVAAATGLNGKSAVNHAAVPGRMALYNKARVKGVLQVVNGLVRRRKAEGDMYKSSTASPCMSVARPNLQATAATPCSQRSGVCKDKSTCTGNFAPVAGLCPGTPAAVQCCLPKTVTPPVPASNNCMTQAGLALIK